jgi:hypothetical protein
LEKNAGVAKHDFFLYYVHEIMDAEMSSLYSGGGRD